MKNFIFHYWKSIIIISIILYLSFAPPSTFKEVPSFENEDKLVHLLMYGGLTCILIFDFRQFVKRYRIPRFSFGLICIILPVLLGGAVEILQPMYFAPRSASWFDFLFDFIGVIIGWIFMDVFKNIVKKIFYSKKN